jgi:hypothetical protein
VRGKPDTTRAISDQVTATISGTSQRIFVRLKVAQ